MISSSVLRRACAAFVVLLVAACSAQRVERRVLVFSPGTVAPGTLAELRQMGESERVALDIVTDPAVFVEDSLARYSAVVFLNSSGDTLSQQQKADFERYVQGGGGFVSLGARPARAWPWFNDLLRARAAGADSLLARGEFDGGRVFRVAAGVSADSIPAERLRTRLREGLDFAVRRPPDYTRARTARVPEANRFQQDVLVLGTIDEPTEMAIASDGRVFFAERKGALKLYEPAAGKDRQIARLPVYTKEENGLIGLTLDPRFDQNRWIYLTYSVEDGPKHRVSRFTFTGDGIADEKVLLEVPITVGCCHTGGSMAWDAQGNLFVSFGDNTNPFNAGSYAPIDPSPGRSLMDARRSSANTQDLRGKILRITPRPDGTYTVPAGNLFSDPKQGRPEIYVMGNRNPYRISVDRRTGFLYWGEIGPDARVDSIYGPKGYDEVNQARAAGNFGWPMFIADNQPYRDFNFTTKQTGELFDPARPVNDSPNNTGARVLPPAQGALIYYPYDASERFPLVGEGGRSAMAGPVYRSEDFPDSRVRLPSYYDGKLLHYEWMRGWLMATTMDQGGDFVKMEPVLEHLEFDHPSDVELGPDGSLYVLEYGTYWFARNANSRLSRITFHAGNRPPRARIQASRTVGAAPLTVELSAAGTVDHDSGDTLRYTWTFDDGSTAQGATVTHTFARPGTHTARLVVSDPSGATGEAQTQIRVGNAPPEVRIVTQGNRSFFWDNAPLNFHVEASDPEEGRLGAGIAPEQVRVTWEWVPDDTGRVAAAAGHQSEPRGLALMKGSDCMACHGVDQASIGPSFRKVAERYAGKAESIVYLVNKIIRGGGGVWGEHVMSAHPTMKPADAELMVRYILSLAGGPTPLPARGAAPRDQHRPGQAGRYVLTATYADQPRNGIGPLEAREQLVLRSPTIRASSIADVRFVGIRAGQAADSTERLIATAFASDAYLHPGRMDLTGVAEVRFTLQSTGKSLTLELRSGGPDGTLLASQSVTAPAANTWFQAGVPVGAQGEHDLYIVLRSPAEGLGQWSPLVRLDAIRFLRPGER